MDIFVPRNKEPRPGFDIGSLFGYDTEGDIGIEIEVEGKSLPVLSNVPKPWKYEKDGSLRGEENAEYVLRQPIKFEGVEAALNALWGKFTEMGTRIDDSNRTSVHVHLNCQKFYLNRFAAFSALYFTLEEVLTNWCGEHRVGNLFCLTAKDAPAIISYFKKFIKNDGAIEIPQKLHYSGLNIHALPKYGSVEIRSLAGCSDPKTILNWVRILERLYKLSGEFEDPREICAMFSGNGPLVFFDTLLGDMSSVVRQGISMTNEDIARSMYEGIRLAQDICYCRDWSLYKKMNIAKDPFGRSAAAIANKILNVTAGAGAPPIPQPPTWMSDEEEEANDYFEPDYDDDDAPESAGIALSTLIWNAQQAQNI